MRIAVISESRAMRLTAQADASATPGGRVSGMRMGRLKTISRRTISGGMPFLTMSSISGNSVFPTSMTTISRMPPTNGSTISPSR